MFPALTTSALLLAAVSTAAASQPGDVAWILAADSFSTGPRPTVAANGTIFWNPTGTLYAISPSGSVLWTASPSGEIDGSHVAIGLNGTLYTASEHSVDARSPVDGSMLWQFTDVGVTQGVLGGPDIGPDGNIYLVYEGGSDGIGMFSLTPSGSLRWSIPGWANTGGNPGSEIVFGAPNHLYKAENIAPTGGPLFQGLFAVSLGGGIDWVHQITVGATSATRSPKVSPLNNNLHVAITGNAAIRTYSPSGAELWIHAAPGAASQTFGPAVGPDGVVYYVTEFKDLYAVNPNGSDKWVADSVIPLAVPPTVPEVSPDGDVVVFGSGACLGAACPGHVAAVDATDGSVLWNIALPNQPEGVMNVSGRPCFSPSGSTVYMLASPFAGGNKAYLFAVTVEASVPTSADLSGDGHVNGTDLAILLAAWGRCVPGGAPCAADFDHNGVVNGLDLAILLGQWG